MKHAAAKKRRRGTKVRLTPRKHRSVRVANAITNVSVKEVYNKRLTPAENLVKFGLEPDANKFISEAAAEAQLDKKHAGFVGFAELPVAPKKKTLSADDREYIQTLVTKYGDNFTAMVRDISTNYNQLTEARLRKLHTALLLEEESR